MFIEKSNTLSQMKLQRAVGLSLLLLVGSVVHATENKATCSDRPQAFMQILREGTEEEAVHFCLTSSVLPGCRTFHLRCLKSLRKHLEKTGSTSRALEMATRLAREDAQDAENAFAQGRLFIHHNQWQGAVEAFERAESDPRLGGDALYNRLLILEAQKWKTEAERRALWERLRALQPKAAHVLLGFAFHHLRLGQWKEGFQLLSNASPSAQALSVEERELLDTSFDRAFARTRPEMRYRWLYRWEKWIAESDRRLLRMAEEEGSRGEWKKAAATVHRLRQRIHQKSMDAEMEQRLHRVSGVAFFRLSQFPAAARALDLCAVDGDSLCVGWLARSLAYLGRWDLAAHHWKKIAEDDRQPPPRRQHVQVLLRQAQEQGLEDLVSERLGYPPWMKTRF